MVVRDADHSVDTHQYLKPRQTHEAAQLQRPWRYLSLYSGAGSFRDFRLLQMKLAWPQYVVLGFVALSLWIHLRNRLGVSAAIVRWAVVLFVLWAGGFFR